MCSGKHGSSHRSIKKSVVACIYNTRPLTKYVFDRLFSPTYYIRLYTKLSQRSTCIYSTRPPTKPISWLTFFFFEGYPILFRSYLCRWCPETVDIPSAKLEASDKTAMPWPYGLFVAEWWRCTILRSQALPILVSGRHLLKHCNIHIISRSQRRKRGKQDKLIWQGYTNL